LITEKGAADTGEPIIEALRLLDLFASVGGDAYSTPNWTPIPDETGQ